MSSEKPNLRERRAQLTREEILRAARGLFAERGYVGTTVRDIAHAAGVSAQTVYDSVGSKQQVVGLLNDLVGTATDTDAILRDVRASDDPAFVVGGVARVTRAILERSGDVMRTMIAGAAAEPDLAAWMADGQGRHLADARAVVDRLGELGALASRRSPDEHTEALAASADVRLGLVLADSYGWPLEQIESWMTEVARGLLLAP